MAKKVKSLVRQKHVHNFETAKTAGILFDAGNVIEFKHIKEFGKYLASIKIECSLIGYSDADEIKDDLLFHDKVSIFSPKDLDLFFRPAQPDALKFTGRKFDMLFDLSLEDHFPLRYILSLSPSAFKIGRFTREDSDLDLMIDIHSNPGVEFLIEQIKNYVSFLNK